MISDKEKKRIQEGNSTDWTVSLSIFLLALADLTETATEMLRKAIDEEKTGGMRRGRDR